eukprot:90784-Chlamydomonas_euryale.AAC.4
MPWPRPACQPAGKSGRARPAQRPTRMRILSPHPWAPCLRAARRRQASSAKPASRPAPGCSPRRRRQSWRALALASASAAAASGAVAAWRAPRRPPRRGSWWRSVSASSSTVRWHCASQCREGFLAASRRR